MKKKASIFTFILILFIGAFGSCQKEDNNGNTNNNDDNNNNNNNTENPVEPDPPIEIYQIPPIDEYMPERLLNIVDSLHILHRGDEPPTVMGHFKAESMSIFLVNTVAESQYMGLESGSLLLDPRFFEFDGQGNDTLKIAFKCPYLVTTDYSFMERSDTDSTYFRIKDNLEHFIDDPIAPPYFKSSKFTTEDFRHAYIIGHDEWFTIYYYEIRNVINAAFVMNSHPMNAVLISGKMGTDADGNPVIDEFWYGMETMVYYGTNVNLSHSPNSGDLIIMQCPSALVLGSIDD